MRPLAYALLLGRRVPSKQRLAVLGAGALAAPSASLTIAMWRTFVRGPASTREGGKRPADECCAHKP
jgi:hypothetical protein